MNGWAGVYPSAVTRYQVSFVPVTLAEGHTTSHSRFPQACLRGAGRMAALPLPSIRRCARHLPPPVSSRCQLRSGAAEAVAVPARLHLLVCRVVMCLCGPLELQAGMICLCSARAVAQCSSEGPLCQVVPAV